MRQFVFAALFSAAITVPISAEPPYPHSAVIEKIEWHWDTYAHAAPGSDLWPVTWGPDDQLYTAWGDGGGFGGTDSDGRVALGFGRIEGTPEHWRGFNVNGGKNPEHPAAFPRKGKAAGVAFVDGVWYALVNLQDGKWPDVNHVLAWSTNAGADWTKAGRVVVSEGRGKFFASDVSRLRQGLPRRAGTARRVRLSLWPETTRRRRASQPAFPCPRSERPITRARRV
jgi:hypothetical protein